MSFLLAKEGSWILIGQFLSLFGSLVLVKILTEFLSPGDYGYIALGLTIVLLNNQVIAGGVSAASARFYSIASEADRLSNYHGAVQNILIIISIITSVFGVLGFTVCHIVGLREWAAMTIPLVLFAVFSAISATFINIQNAGRKRSSASLLKGLESWLKVLFCLLLLSRFGSESFLVFTAFYLSSLVVVLVLVLTNRDSYFLDISIIPFRGYWENRIVRYALPFSVWGMFTWMQQAAPRWALERFARMDEVGLLQVLLQLGYTPIMMLAAFLATLTMPILFDQIGDSTDRNRILLLDKSIETIIVYSLLVSFVIFMLAFWFHDFVFMAFTDEHYWEASKYLPWLVLSGGMYAMSQILSNKILALMKPDKIILLNVGSALFGVALSIVGAYLYGLAGVVCSYIIFSATHLFFVSVIARFETQKILLD